MIITSSIIDLLISYYSSIIITDSQLTMIRVITTIYILLYKVTLLH